MKISACIITDDNYKIKDCLNSIKSSVSEIVVTYTKSNEKFYKWLDKTLSETGVKYILNKFKWCDDFSKARNYGLNCATEDWILIIDADEMLESEIKFEKEDFDYCFIYQVNPGTKPIQHIRLFRNNLGIHFTNKLHETVEPFVIGLRPYVSELRLIHTPIVDDVKLNRNIRILKKDKKSFVYDLYMMHYYFNQQKYYKAIKYGLKALNNTQLNEEAKATVSNVLAESYMKIGSPETAKEMLKLSFSIFPNQYYARIQMIDFLIKEKNPAHKSVIKAALEKIRKVKSEMTFDIQFKEELLTKRLQEIATWQ